jgi:hypothetical protein
LTLRSEMPAKGALSDSSSIRWLTSGSPCAAWNFG